MATGQLARPGGPLDGLSKQFGATTVQLDALTTVTTPDGASSGRQHQGVIDVRAWSAASLHDRKSRARIAMDNELSRVIDSLPGMVWTALPDGHLDFVNQRWSEYTGLSAEAAYGRGWQTMIHPVDLPQLLDGWRSILASGEPGEMDARLRRSDGEYHWFEFGIRPLADASGQVVKWCGMNTDIEDRKRAADEAERARDWDLRSIADSIPALIALMTPDGEVESVNRQMLEYYGTTLEE